MQSLSGTRLCLQQSNSEKATVEPHESLWWRCPINAQDRNNITSTSYNPAPIRRRSIEDDLPPDVLETSCDGDKMPPLKDDGSNCLGYSHPSYYRRTSTAVSYRHHNSDVARQQERAFATRPLPLRPHTEDAGNIDTCAATSQASTPDSAADTVPSCELDSSLTAPSLLSSHHHGSTVPCVFHNNTRPTNFDANDEVEAQISASQDADTHLANEASSSEREKHEFESGDGAAGCLSSSSSCGQLEGLSPLLNLNTEFRENWFAAPEDSRYLFLEYWERTHGDRVIEAENQSEAYWKWDQDRYQWFHRNPKTQSVTWFLG